MIKDVINHGLNDENEAAQALTVIGPSIEVPAFFAPDAKAEKDYINFFTAKIRNPHTRRAYARAAVKFAAWCVANGIGEIRDIEPIHVASYIELLQFRISPRTLTRIKPPSVKQQLAAIRMLFDWLVLGQVIVVNPASPVRGPRYSVKKGKTHVLDADEARRLLDSIDEDTPTGCRDRALIALMVYTFARISAALAMTVKDVYVQGRRTWVSLHEKGGKEHEMPCHHNLEGYLHAHIDDAGIVGEPNAFLFRTYNREEREFTEEPMTQADAYRMIRRRTLKAGIATKIGNHSFRATGITEYLRNGGKLEIAQQMANHESARTTGLYDRRDDQLSLDEIERIVI
jgi:site-specific recombinase XerD